ncbi:hypothetical protein [Natrarchaeobaculum sulfurireducens]|nr:hypothetical protein [Natrarchaeobaculum sulfurireducens]
MTDDLKMPATLETWTYPSLDLVVAVGTIGNSTDPVVITKSVTDT